MTSFHPLQHLQQLDDHLADQSGYTGPSRWMIPYADFLTILLGFFIILFAFGQMENAKLNQRIQKAQKQTVTSQKQAKTARKQLAQLKASLLAQGKNPQTLLEKAPPISDQTVQALEKALLIEGDSGANQPITISRNDQGVIISFQDRLFFDPGRSELTPKAGQTLDKLSDVLTRTAHPIRVEGHTDNTPIQTAQFPSNWELSTARATTIVKHLVQRHHFPPQRLSAAGFGEFHPLADNSTIEGKQKNRRVDIVLLNPLPGPLPGSDSPSPKNPKE